MILCAIVLILLSTVVNSDDTDTRCQQAEVPRLNSCFKKQRMRVLIGNTDSVNVDLSMVCGYMQRENATHMVIGKSTFRVDLASGESSTSEAGTNHSFTVSIGRIHIDAPEPDGFSRIYSRNLPPNNYDGSRFERHVQAASRGMNIPKKAKKFILYILFLLKGTRFCNFHDLNDD